MISLLEGIFRYIRIRAGSGIFRHTWFRSWQTNKHERPTRNTLIAQALGDEGIVAEDWPSEEERSVAQIRDNVPRLRDAFRTLKLKKNYKDLPPTTVQEDSPSSRCLE